MRIVIQCAGRKAAGSGKFLTTDGRDVMFVANPSAAPQQAGVYYARPDDLSDSINTWRDRLIEYNHSPETNPLSLCPHVSFTRIEPIKPWYLDLESTRYSFCQPGGD